MSPCQRQVLTDNQSVTSRFETSRYRDFSQFFESIGLGLENFGLEKKSRYRSRKYLVSKKSLGIGLENIWSRKKVSVSVSKTLVSKKVSVSVSKILVSKKSQYRSRKFWSQKSLGIGLKNFGLKKSSSYADIIFQRDTSNTFNDFVS